MITGGQLIAFAVAAGLNETYNGWRILFGLSLPFAIGQAIAMHWLPESPRFALIQGKTEEATRVLRKIYPLATEEELNLKLKAMQLMVDVSTALKRKHPSLLGRLRVVFTTGTYIRCVLCAAFVFFGQQLSGWNTLLYYSDVLFGSAGFNNVSGPVARDSATFFTDSQRAAICGRHPRCRRELHHDHPQREFSSHRAPSYSCTSSRSLPQMYTMDRIGRRRIFLIGLPVMIVALVIASVAFHFMTEETGGEVVRGFDYNQTWVGLMIGMSTSDVSGTSCGTAG